ncbi:ATP-binding response regulator [Desulfofustis glycolicus]|uniref:histidine kinase n=1 Tax=Desulfofustis glycolicus DSM 9705 TaxID=1121409 RepID=A0A1M5WVG0_9BACT|nr:response regulator [Desulfofustis glycolicus]MCB2214456.1 response regulator [Desulfobulbaceae bacterium]SHH91382.1 Signal transduction histidine kinase [Desulfofustis glycolicus DSM 9705]
MSSGQPRALVVDNNPVLLKAISTLVQREGCLVHTAENGLEALEIFKREPVDIVFTDLVMPLVSGEQLCRVIRQTPDRGTVFIVVISAIPIAEAKRIMATISCDLCIVKGSLAEMRSNIHEALERFSRQSVAADKVLGDQAGLFERQGGELSIAGEILAEKMHREEIVASLSEGVIELNEHGKIVDINRAALDILDCEVAGIIGSDLVAIGWGEHDETIASWLNGELRGRGMKPLTIGDDRPIRRHNRVLVVSLLAVAGASYFGICIIRDITRQYRAEEYQRKLDRAIRLVKKMDALSGMAGGVAHDFNNLLAVICGSIEVAELALDSGAADQVREKLERAKMSAQTAVELVRKISQSSAYGIIDRETSDIDSVLQHAVASFSADPAPTVEIVLESGDVSVSIDREQIVTAVVNVLRNSAEAGATRVTISGHRVRFAEPLVVAGQYVPAGNYLQLDLTDDGGGIEAGHIPEIFDPYYSTKQRGVVKGMGLGLAVVYSTLRNHGGYVVVTSEMFRGTTVSFYLPLLLEQQQDAATSVTHVGNSILLVEGDEQTALVAAAMIEYLGLEVVSAATSEIALARYRQAIGNGARFAAALINLREEEDARAVELCRNLRAIDADVRIIATSGTPVGPVMSHCRDYGFSNALPKPYTLDDLRNILALGRGGGVS